MKLSGQPVFKNTYFRVSVFFCFALIYFYLGIKYSESNGSLFFYSLNTKPQILSNDPQTLYKEAVVDAKTVRPDKISQKLIPIIPENTDLIRDETGEVLVLVWTDYSGYDNYLNKKMAMGKEAWVTLVPELENFCQPLGLDYPETVLRLEQVLGLPPNNNKTRFVEAWVAPEQLFRSCPDSEINDSECDLDYPVSAFNSVNIEYQKWFEHLKSISYLDNGYPWTRLGYTYDWGSSKSHIGLSEFVIKQGAEVIVKNVLATQEYITLKCNNKK